MYREPEVIFWVFAFPVLLALGLGIAFRNKPAEIGRIAVVTGPQANQVLDLLHAPSAAGKVHADLLTAVAASNQFRLGKYDLVVIPHAGSIEYLYDPARPESVLARAITDNALQSAAEEGIPFPPPRKFPARPEPAISISSFRGFWE